MMIFGDTFTAHGSKWFVIEDYGDMVLACAHPISAINTLSLVNVLLNKEKDERITADKI